MQKKLFAELGISPEVLRAIDQMGFEEASPIQSEAIPPLLQGRDLVGTSQTGSGKTAAFGIPAIECVDPQLRRPQVLILCPTRELAVQVAEEIAKLASFKPGVRELPIYGGASYDRQFRGLDQGAQVVIGTPGRLMDHLERGSLKLDALKMVVLDEADRMLDMGFVDDIRQILEQSPAERQTVCFSATFPPQIRNLIETFTRDPISVRIESQQMTVPSIDQSYYEVERRSKIEALCRIIDFQDLKFGIIFCATKLMCDDLTDHLCARGLAAEQLHGGLSQAMRERVLARFKKHDVEFLVATDVAARGLDVDDVEVVFNYDLPHDGEDYVHRIGRTGRAGQDGRAVTLVAGREIYKLQHIMRFIGTGIRRERVPTMEELEHKRTNVMMENVRATLERGEHRKYEVFVDRLLEGGYSPTDIATALFQIVAGDTGDTYEAPRPAAVKPPVPSTAAEPVAAGQEQRNRPDRRAGEPGPRPPRQDDCRPHDGPRGPWTEAKPKRPSKPSRPADRDDASTTRATSRAAKRGFTVVSTGEERRHPGASSSSRPPFAGTYGKPGKPSSSKSKSRSAGARPYPAAGKAGKPKRGAR